VFVSENTAGFGTPFTKADTVYDPWIPFAVYRGEVATPVALVIAVMVPWPPANTPLGPLAGARKVTVTPLTGFMFESVTVAANGATYCVLITALCGVPPLAFTVAGAAPVTVTMALAGANPDADALMVAEPRLIALTWGWVAGVVDPAAIKTDPGDTVTLFISVLDNITLVPPDGAGVPS
jgi:hypothetical protein